MNIKNTKVMRVSKTPDEPITIKIENANLEQVHQFKYLGTQITDDARTETELQCRIAKAKYSSMNKLFTSRQLSRELKVCILNCYLMPIFTYGCEAWTLSEVLEAKIDVFEMWCFRRMGRKSWKDRITNNEVLAKLGTERNLSVKQRQLRYYGHIKRQNGFLAYALEGGHAQPG